MANLPTYEEMTKKLAEKALDEYVYKDKTLREWINILAQTQWIPVNEGLPKKAVGCLVTVEDSNIYGEPYRVIYPDFVGYDGKTWHDADGMVIPFEVIAWIQLPEPYKEESEG